MIRTLHSLSKLASGVLLAGALAGCGLLAAGRAPAPSLFTLQPVFASEAAGGPRGAPAEPAPAIVIAPPGARPGFEGARMAYVTRAYELRYFARHQWVEPPARLLAPLLAAALERGGRFRPVQAHTGIAPVLRLDTEIVALQQEFDVRPSQLRFAVRAQLVDAAAGRVLGTTEIEAVEPAGSDDPYAGVVAANRAVARVLEQLAAWCEAQSPRRAGS